MFTSFTTVSASTANRWFRPFSVMLWALALLCAGAASAQSDGDPEDSLESLKEETLSLNRDLLVLEEELLYPASSQLAVYLSVDLGDFFHLDSVRLQVDGEPVTAQLYTQDQREALHRGGIQRLYRGNVDRGEHEISAVFTGVGPDGRDYKRGTRHRVQKGQEPVVLELKIVDSARKLQPEFRIEQWSLE